MIDYFFIELFILNIEISRSSAIESMPPGLVLARTCEANERLAIPLR
jgi:hypothetical protein